MAEPVSANSDQKGPEAYRTISEVASDLDLPQHVLRFWETRFSQIKPMKRAGGRRFYRPQDVDLLRGNLRRAAAAKPVICRLSTAAAGPPGRRRS